MHIPNANILEMVKDKAKITIAIKYEIIYGLSIGILVLSKDQGQGHVHFDDIYFENGELCSKNYHCLQTEVCMSLLLTYLHLILSCSKGQGKSLYIS